MLRPSCTVNPSLWLIAQKGNAILAWTFPERYNQGIKVANDDVARIAPATGVISGSSVKLSDDTHRWVLACRHRDLTVRRARVPMYRNLITAC